MGVSPTRKNERNNLHYTSRFNKKKRSQLQKDAKAEIKDAKQKFKKNVHSYSWWSNFVRLSLIIIFYFSSSIALTFYQKDLLKVSLKMLIAKFWVPMQRTTHDHHGGGDNSNKTKENISQIYHSQNDIVFRVLYDCLRRMEK